MMRWFSKKEITPAPKQVPQAPKNRLIVYFSDGSHLYWEQEPHGGLYTPWRHFLKWFYGREQSATYTMAANRNTHSSTFYRRDIKRFTIAIRSAND
jgi:hypothetical protein